MKKSITLLFLIASLSLKSQDISFDEIKNCSKPEYQKAFIAKLLEKKYLLIKKDSTINGKAAYYAFKGDSSEFLITVHSYNMVDFRFTSSKNKILTGILKEIYQNYKGGCFGDAFSLHVRSNKYNAKTIDYKTKAILYEELANHEIRHLILVSPYSDITKVKHSKREGINCSIWYTVCDLPDGQK